MTSSLESGVCGSQSAEGGWAGLGDAAEHHLPTGDVSETFVFLTRHPLRPPLDQVRKRYCRRFSDFKYSMARILFGSHRIAWIAARPAHPHEGSLVALARAGGKENPSFKWDLIGGRFFCEECGDLFKGEAEYAKANAVDSRPICSNREIPASAKVPQRTEIAGSSTTRSARRRRHPRARACRTKAGAPRTNCRCSGNNDSRRFVCRRMLSNYW